VLKAYAKPGLTRVDLVPSEAVLTACKDFVTYGPFGGGTYCWEGCGSPCKEASS
jgi:hypothetical protein